MLHYKAFELHTHTKHSDGTFEVSELLENAAKYKYDGIALTDHNTMSGHEEITSELESKTLPVIRGIEWTTFFGHMVVLNAKKYIDWRFATPDTIDDYTKAIQEVDGVVGIAHPCVLGSPICTGCNWNFKIKDWNFVNYIEVWSNPYPNERYENGLAYTMWTDLLKQGYKLSATSGRDWHGLDKVKRPHVVSTYLGVDEDILTGENAANALKKGRTFVSAGPYMDMSFKQNNVHYNLGDEIKEGNLEITVNIDETVRKDIWEGFNIKTKTIKIIQNGDVCAEFNGTQKNFNIIASKGFIRVEIYGDYLTKENQLLGFSSPIYIK